MKNNKDKNKTKKVWVKGMLLGTLGVGLLFPVFENTPLTQAYEPLLTVSAQDEANALTEHEKIITGVVDNSKDAVVSVSNFQRRVTDEKAFEEALLGYYFGVQGGLDLEEFESELQLVGSGSGVVYKIDGDRAYIVSNHHVVEGAEALEITMANGETTEAELIGSDALSDLAVLTIPAEVASQTLEFANSDDVRVGSTAIAIGSPVDSEFASSVTKGIVSGLDRSIPVDTDGDQQPDWEMTLLQTDAAINPGNSGGALVDTSGKLIGINSSKLASSEIEGMGFAIPSNDVQTIIAQLESKGAVSRPVLGVSTYNVSDVSLESRQDILKLPEDVTSGALVVDVAPQSAADKAGVEIYDVITAIDGETVENAQGLRQELYKHKLGDTIEIKVLREGKEETLKATLEDEAETANPTE